MADDVALDANGDPVGDYPAPDVGPQDDPTWTPPYTDPAASTPEGMTPRQPFNWGGLDTFINDLDQQAAAWYVLTKQQTPSARTLPPALAPLGDTLATIPPIVWIALGGLVLVLVLRK